MQNPNQELEQSLFFVRTRSTFTLMQTNTTAKLMAHTVKSSMPTVVNETAYRLGSPKSSYTSQSEIFGWRYTND
jgi:hypothetical protein